MKRILNKITNIYDLKRLSKEFFSYGLFNNLSILASFLRLRNLQFSYPMSKSIFIAPYQRSYFWKRVENKKWEYAQLIFYTKIIKSSDIIFDVGAWIGVSSLYFSILVGSSGKIYAFEPMESSFNYLKELLRLNRINNVQIEKLAVSDSIGELEITESKKFDDLATMKSHLQGKKKKVPCITLDDFCIRNNIIPTGIKIDVEGGEIFVLRGAYNIIQKYHPWIVLEYHGPFLSSNEKKELWKFIKSNNYDITYIDGDKREKIDLERPPQYIHHFYLSYGNPGRIVNY